MLIEVKAKVARIIDNKTRKRTETFLVDKEFFSEAEYRVTQALGEEQSQGSIESFKIISLKESSIMEIAHQFDGSDTFIATLKSIWIDEDGSEKSLRYKVLLWADDLTAANNNVQHLAREGYDMQIECIQQVDYEYFNDNNNEETA